MVWQTYTTWKVSVFGVILVRIFSHLDWIRGNTEYLSVFSLNAGKYGPEWLRVRTLFMQCYLKHFCKGIFIFLYSNWLFDFIMEKRGASRRFSFCSVKMEIMFHFFFIWWWLAFDLIALKMVHLAFNQLTFSQVLLG